MVNDFCWVDLAARDAKAALAFYGNLFGWTACEQFANGGVFTRLQNGGRDFSSIYQLRERQIADGLPSHWTPYVRVSDIDMAIVRTAALGGRTVVRPFRVADLARIAVIVDPVGASVGLWEPVARQGEKADV